MSKTIKYDPATIEYLAQLNPKPTSGFWIGQLDRFVRQLKVDNNWQELDRLWIFATTVQQNARVSLVNPTATTITEVNAPTWKANTGYTGNASNMYLNTNYNPLKQGVNYTLNSATMGYYILNDKNQTGGRTDMGAQNAATEYNGNFLYKPTTWSYNGLINGNGTLVYNYANPLLGSFSMVQSSHTITQLYNRGILLASSATTALSILNLNLFVIAMNNNGNPNSLSNQTYAMAYAGSGKINQLKLYNSIQNFLNAVGCAV